MPHEEDDMEEDVEDWFHGRHDVGPNWVVDMFHKQDDPKEMELFHAKFIRSVWEAITIWVDQIQGGVKEEEEKEKSASRTLMKWVDQIQEGVEGEREGEGHEEEEAGGLPYEKVKEASEEEITFMRDRKYGH